MDTDQLEQIYGTGNTEMSHLVGVDHGHAMPGVWDSWDSLELMMTPVGQGVPWV